MVSFPVQKLFSLIKTHLFIFAFVSSFLGEISKIIAMIYIKDILLMFSSRSFMIFWFYI